MKVLTVVPSVGPAQVWVLACSIKVITWPGHHQYLPYVVEVGTTLWAVVARVITSVLHCPWVVAAARGAVGTNRS